MKGGLLCSVYVIELLLQFDEFVLLVQEYTRMQFSKASEQCEVFVTGDESRQSWVPRTAALDSMR